MFRGTRNADLPGAFHLRCPAVKHGSDTLARGMRDDDVDRTSPRRSVLVADISVADAKRELEVASQNRVPPIVLPLMSLLAEPAPPLLAGIANLTGRQLDANHQS